MSNKATQFGDALKKAGLDALILTKQENQRYLEGFTGGDCYMLASARMNFLIADSRYKEMGERECRTAKVLQHRSPHPSFGEVIAKLAGENGFLKIGFEENDITWREYKELERYAEIAEIKLVPTLGLIESLRARKTPEEAAFTAAACQIADRALTGLLPLIKPGVSELDLATELEYLMKKGGAEGLSFSTIVLFGARSSQPHATPSGDVRLESGNFVLIDYGASRRGYRSDTTRTFVCGKASDEQKQVYRAVQRAQMASLEKAVPGASARELNQASLDILKNAGQPCFEHSIGHGVGLEIHEEPSMRLGAETALEPGMIITIEPGTYRPGWGGVRIEDTILITEDGNRVLTLFPKELMEL